MYEYNTVVSVLGFLLMCIMLSILYTDEILDYKDKRGFTLAFLVCMLNSLIELLLMYLEVNQIEKHFETTFIRSTIFFLGTVITSILSWTIQKHKTKKYKLVFAIVFLFNFLLPFSALFTDKIFYYDELNTYVKGEFFYIYLTQMLISTGLMFYSMYNVSESYQMKSKRYLLIIIVIFLFGFYMNFVHKDFKILWITALMVFAFVYLFYSTLMNQMDVLTGLLNRRSYESQVYDIKNEAIILILDVNKFKSINDTYGHAFGDVCLSTIGKAIYKTYAKYGNCYRIGGDEFCVILTKELEKVDELIESFNRVLSESKVEHILPTVSTGYCRYTSGKSSVQKTIEDADEMMYLIKSKNR